MIRRVKKSKKKCKYQILQSMLDAGELVSKESAYKKYHELNLSVTADYLRTDKHYPVETIKKRVKYLGGSYLCYFYRKKQEA